MGRHSTCPLTRCLSAGKLHQSVFTVHISKLELDFLRCSAIINLQLYPEVIYVIY